MDTTETEYTLDHTDQHSQSQTPVLRPGSSITSLSTGIDTPVQTESLTRNHTSISDEIATAEKLFKTAITNYASESPSSKPGNDYCPEQEIPLEEELLQDLLTVPAKNAYRDAETQVSHGVC